MTGSNTVRYGRRAAKGKPRRARGLSALGAVALLALSLVARRAGAAEASVVPAPIELPATLSLAEAMALFRKSGLDLLIADAATRGAEANVKIAGEVANPVMSINTGNAITYSSSYSSRTNCLANGAVCSPWVFNVSASDSNALEDWLSGKRDLRIKVARNALAAAKLSRLDAERTIAFQVKSQYAQVAQAVLALKFAREVAGTNLTTLKKFRDRLKAGSITPGDLQRIETQKLESDQAVDVAVMNLRQARVTLAFLLGVRGAVPDFDVDVAVLDYATPSALSDASEKLLTKLAFDHRPDLVSLGYSKAAAASQIELNKRQRFPDVALGVTYAWGGFGGYSTNGPIQGQMVTFGLTFSLPVFNQLDGEIRSAYAQYDGNALQYEKLAAQVTNDVATAFAAFVASRKLVQRMEGPRRDDGGLLESAKGAFETIAVQYDKGAPGVTLTDYLDALRTYIATKVEYYGDLTNYRTAVFQLEEAVGMDLR